VSSVGELAPLQDSAPTPTKAGASAAWGALEGIGSVLLAFAIYILGIVILGESIAVASRSAYDQHPIEVNILAYQFLGIGTATCAYFVLSRRHHVGAAALGFRYPGWNTLLWTAASVLPILIGVSLFAAGFDHLFPAYHLHGNANQIVAGHTGSLPVAEKISIFAWVAIEAPIVEETLFRGILFQGLRQFFARVMPYAGSVAIAALSSGVIFGLSHFEFQTLPVLALLGVVLAVVFQITKSIYASMLVHGIFNAVGVLYVLQST
jgi:membrane protease YdiL (CAAX protease family)